VHSKSRRRRTINQAAAAAAAAWPQQMDTSGDGSLSCNEFCTSIKQLVRSAAIAACGWVGRSVCGMQRFGDVHVHGQSSAASAYPQRIHHLHKALGVCSRGRGESEVWGWAGWVWGVSIRPHWHVPYSLRAERLGWQREAGMATISVKGVVCPAKAPRSHCPHCTRQIIRLASRREDDRIHIGVAQIRAGIQTLTEIPRS
jgi:hypothetical protein